jgi:hypothetical protein
VAAAIWFIPAMYIEGSITAWALITPASAIRAYFLTLSPMYNPFVPGILPAL